MKNRMGKVVGLSVYLLAGILLIYTLWAFSHCAGYIGDMIKADQLVFAGNEYDIINFYMSSCGQYFIFAVLLAAVGFVVLKNPALPQAEDVSSEKAADVHSREDAEIDDWFGEVKDQ